MTTLYLYRCSDEDYMLLYINIMGIYYTVCSYTAHVHIHECGNCSYQSLVYTVGDMFMIHVLYMLCALGVGTCEYAHVHMYVIVHTHPNYKHTFTVYMYTQFP